MRKVFDEYATFAATAASGTAVTLLVPVPETPPMDGTYLVSVLPDADLGSEVQVAFYNRIPLTTPVRGTETRMVPVGTTPFATVNAGEPQGILVQGWLVGESPAHVVLTLTAAASSTGGRVWVVVYAVGR
jgi:hypothetical protein